jgi:hypothetical protein
MTAPQTGRHPWKLRPQAGEQNVHISQSRQTCAERTPTKADPAWAVWHQRAWVNTYYRLCLSPSPPRIYAVVNATLICPAQPPEVLIDLLSPCSRWLAASSTSHPDLGYGATGRGGVEHRAKWAPQRTGGAGPPGGALQVPSVVLGGPSGALRAGSGALSGWGQAWVGECGAGGLHSTSPAAAPSRRTPPKAGCGPPCTWH